MLKIATAISTLDSSLTDNCPYTEGPRPKEIPVNCIAMTVLLPPSAPRHLRQMRRMLAQAKTETL